MELGLKWLADRHNAKPWFEGSRMMKLGERGGQSLVLFFDFISHPLKAPRANVCRICTPSLSLPVSSVYTLSQLIYGLPTVVKESLFSHFSHLLSKSTHAFLLLSNSRHVLLDAVYDS